MTVCTFEQSIWSAVAVRGSMRLGSSFIGWGSKGIGSRSVVCAVLP